MNNVERFIRIKNLTVSPIFQGEFKVFKINNLILFITYINQAQSLSYH